MDVGAALRTVQKRLSRKQPQVWSVLSAAAGATDLKELLPEYFPAKDTEVG